MARKILERASPVRDLMKRTVLTLVFLFASSLAALPAGAQDWAKAQLAKSPRHSEWVTVKHDGRAVETFVVYP
jgi:carboxymethylenebutenolidase